jgi:hypothetical protein
MDKNCEDCKFARVLYRKGDTYFSFQTKQHYPYTETTVECRRRSPALSPWENQPSGWPAVNAIGGCGEHEPLEETA